jgi:exopolysaccharide production protein ExoQ
MPPNIALFICFVGIAGLFFLDRDKSVRTSKALWLPTIWLWIVGSRSVSAWLGVAPAPGVDVQLDGSPVDRFVFIVLLAAGIIVLIHRSRQTRAILSANWPVLIYFAFCLVSVLWSDFPEIAFKRWFKSIGDLVMVLIVVTDPEPFGALKRFLSRVGFVLLPPSIVLTRYFGNLGRAYTPDGLSMNTGVTTNKNTLGVITLVLALGAVWRVVMLLFREGREPNRGRRLLAQGALLAIAVAVLAMSQSATSQACFALGTALILATHFRTIRRHPGAVHALVLTILLGGGAVMFFGGGAGVTQVLGRESTLTGRTDIWAAVLPVVPNPVVGAGFETFWLGPRLERVWSHLSKYNHTNEAHNGYIEVYLNLGWLGVALIAIILLRGYNRTVAVFRYDPVIGSLLLAYVFAAAFHSITEAGFRLLDPGWVFLLLAVVAAGGMASGTGKRARRRLGTPASIEDFSRRLEVSESSYRYGRV